MCAFQLTWNVLAWHRVLLVIGVLLLDLAPVAGVARNGVVETMVEHFILKTEVIFYKY